MSIHTEDHTAAVLRRALADDLAEQGALRRPCWRQAFEDVPRHEYVPRFFRWADNHCFEAVDPTAPDALEQVYRDTTLVTQINGDDDAWERSLQQGPLPGVPTSSSTQPVLMALMLDALDVADGHRVLEIGTGTGYNAALLRHRLGPDRVTTIDIDPTMVTDARNRLAANGDPPTVAVADAMTGFPANGPYDRILATVSVPEIPYAWVQQTRPRGKLLTHLHRTLDAGGLLLAAVDDSGKSAHGTFLPDYGSFMPLRCIPRPDGLALLQQALRGPAGARRASTLSTDVLNGNDFILFAALHVEALLWWFTPDDTRTTQTWLLHPDGSWAYQQPADDELCVEQSGPRHLWDELEAAHAAWLAAGKPTRDRIGVTISADAHRIWLDSPDHELTIPR
ncbi:MAG: ATP-grasp peptide maturase system methyltransferase [Pseudonocardiaceae bacterium]